MLLPFNEFKTLDELNKKLLTCQGCELHKTRINIVKGKGNPSSKLFLLGEGPGENEDREGKAFIGRAGKLLDELLVEAGITDYWIQNVIRCRAPNNRIPITAEISACSRWLTEEVRLIKPKIIILLGNTAKKAYDKGYLDSINTQVVKTIHPAYVLRQPSRRGQLLSDLIHAKELANEE